MTTYADKIILATLVIWFFLVRMHYQEKARWPRLPHPTVPVWERLLVAATSLWLAPVLIFVFTTWMDSLNLPLPEAAHKAGAVVMSMGVLLFWWAHIALGRNWTPFLEIKPHHTLVTSGPYHWVRHPMYLSVLIIGLGMLLISGSWVIGGIYFLPQALLYLMRVRSEEEMMQHKFGDVYSAYVRRTGRLLPHFNSLQKPN
jgi:protein-S-isoprenylcysteine O-methyltransferase Ste14